MRLLDTLFEQTVTGLNKAMDLAWRRSTVLASNVANVETPKYRATELDFGKELERAFGSNQEQQVMRTHASHMELSRDSSARVIADPRGNNKADGNNVDIDLQMSALADNAGDFANAAQLMKYKIGLYRTSIREGRG